MVYIAPRSLEESGRVSLCMYVCLCHIFVTLAQNQTGQTFCPQPGTMRPNKQPSVTKTFCPSFHFSIQSPADPELSCSYCHESSQVLSYQYMTPILRCLYWLRITKRIEYKLLSLRPTYKVLTTTQPPYLHNLAVLALHPSLLLLGHLHHSL